MTPRWGEVRMWIAFFGCLGIFILGSYVGAARAGADPALTPAQVCTSVAVKGFDRTVFQLLADGLTTDQAGKVLASAVADVCPDKLGALQAWVGTDFGPVKL